MLSHWRKALRTDSLSSALSINTKFIQIIIIIIQNRVLTVFVLVKMSDVLTGEFANSLGADVQTNPV